MKKQQSVSVGHSHKIATKQNKMLWLVSKKLHLCNDLKRQLKKTMAGKPARWTRSDQNIFKNHGCRTYIRTYVHEQKEWKQKQTVFISFFFSPPPLSKLIQTKPTSYAARKKSRFIFFLTIKATLFTSHT